MKGFHSLEGRAEALSAASKFRSINVAQQAKSALCTLQAPQSDFQAQVLTCRFFWSWGGGGGGGFAF